MNARKLNLRPSKSCSSLKESEQSATKSPLEHSNWTLSDAVELNNYTPKLPLTSFNHIAREVLNLDRSKRFYMDILGFREIPRPPFDCNGVWLLGYGLNLHLVTTSVPEERYNVKLARIQHFSSALPRVDHIAFITSDVDKVKEVLDKEKVFYDYRVLSDVGIRQVFMFDPDGNVVEISNCAPPVGETTCKNPGEVRFDMNTFRSVSPGSHSIESHDFSDSSANREASYSMCSEDFSEGDQRNSDNEI